MQKQELNKKVKTIFQLFYKFSQDYFVMAFFFDNFISDKSIFVCPDQSITYRGCLDSHDVSKMGGFDFKLSQALPRVVVKECKPKYT